jgi:amino-acid N-acetyltransferase
MRSIQVRRFDGATVRGLVRAQVRGSAVRLRDATADDVDAIHSLIAAHVAEGHLLPRTREDIVAHAARFVVATDGEQVIGCADVAPLSASVGEIRSLVIGEGARGFGIGRRLLAGAAERATAAGLTTLCAFTSAPGFFVQSGFSIVPHTWLPEKIATDCRGCSRFRTCGQYGVMLSLATRNSR